MSYAFINPIHWSVDQLIAYGSDAIYSLAANAAGTRNAYHIVLGRCLLAMDRSKSCRAKGYSGSIHYATSKLGMKSHDARAMRRVAARLESLPLLSRAAESGQIEWSKLREVVRRATPETEAFWLELCKKTYRELTHLLRRTPIGGLPGDIPEAGEREPSVTELRLSMGSLAKQTMERGLQILSLQHGRPLLLSEAVEWLFAEVVTKDKTSSEELMDLGKSQEEARKDLLAQQYRRDPEVQAAREIARSMGVMVEARLEEGEQEEIEEEGEAAAEALDAPVEISDLLETAFGGPLAFDIFENGIPHLSHAEGQKCTARYISPSSKTTNNDDDSAWNDLIDSHKVICPTDQNVVLLAKDWRNRRIRFNPQARHTTDAQRREILRRDGYCCSVPGCPNRLWLELHHVIYVCRNGKTISSNLVTLCSRCHKNVHDGHLRIQGQAPDKLTFTDRNGNDLSQMDQLGVAGWLDYWLGWTGELENSHKFRLVHPQLAHTG